MTDSDKQRKFRLIFHIGAGKTGTSSLQESLRLSKERLNRSHVDYWGLMLESAPEKLFDWQVASGTTHFLALNAEEAQLQIEEVIAGSIAKAKEQGIHTAIWSNEWFFGRHQSVLPALKSFENEVDIKVIAYVRRHDAWARSAYVQWGIKHKGYEGPLMPFREYISKRPVRFASSLKPWATEFPKAFLLRNFDAVGDVVRDFLRVFEIPEDIKMIRTNETPSMEELVLRAFFNDTMMRDCPPVEFDRLFGARQINFNRNMKSWIDELLPTAEDLAAVVQSSGEDRELTNQMLSASEQHQISTEPNFKQWPKLDNEIMMGLIIQMMVIQAKKLQKLQQEVRELNNKLDSEDL